jgi:CBS domain-containing protein
MTARSIMSANPALITPDVSIRAAAEVMREHGVGFLPVVESLESPRLLGVLSEHDIVERCVASGHGAGCCVRDHMTTTGIETANPDDDLDAVLKRMATGYVYRLPVVDAKGHVIGIVTHSDVVMRVSPDEWPWRAQVLQRMASGSRLR